MQKHVLQLKTYRRTEILIPKSSIDFIDLREYDRRVHANFGNGQNPDSHGHATRGLTQYHREMRDMDRNLERRGLGFMLSQAVNTLPNVRGVVLESVHKPKYPDDRLEQVSRSISIFESLNLYLSC